MGQNAHTWGETSIGRTVRGAKSPDTIRGSQLGDGRLASLPLMVNCECSVLFVDTFDRRASL